MPALQTFTEKDFPDLSKAKVGTVAPCLIYYVTTGRNAWHSTWVQQYSNGCMHTSLQSAKDYAEKRRTQGTVFTIKEQPALQVRTAKGQLFATQINTSRPLAEYSRDALREQPAHGSKLIKDSRDNYLSKGASALGAALSFDCASRFWRTAPPRKNSVIVVASGDRTLELEPLRRRKLKAWSSFSNGGGYLLGWRERENDTAGRQIITLATADK